MQRAILGENRCHGSASAIKFRFEHYTSRWTIWIRLQLLQVRNQANHFEQQVQIRFLFCGDIDKDGFTAPVFRHQSAIGQLLFHAVRQGTRLVNFIDRNDDRHFRGVRVIDGFKSLRHHAIVGSDYEHNDVGCFRAARTHASKRFVAGRIQEHNLAPEGRRALVLYGNLVRADVLRDSAGFAFCDAGGTDRVEQRRLTVIDVTHNCDHRRARNSFCAAFFGGSSFGSFFRGLLFEADDVRLCAEEPCHFAGQLSIQILVDGREYAFRQQPRDQVFCADLQLLGKIFYADSFGDGDVPRDRQRFIRKRQPRRRNKALHRAFLHPSRHVSLTRPARRPSKSRSA